MPAGDWPVPHDSDVSLNACGFTCYRVPPAAPQSFWDDAFKATNSIIFLFEPPEILTDEECDTPLVVGE